MTESKEYLRRGTLTGHCLCGAVRIDVEGEHEAAVGVCHCHMCQTWSGLLFGTFDAAAGAVTVSGEVTRYRSSALSERAFCPVCGSNLWMRNHAEGASYELMPGLFRGAAGFPLRSEIYVDQAPAHVRLAGDHPRLTAAEYAARNATVEGDAR